MSQWALITGAGGGIGAALAVHLAGSGYKVLAVDINFEILEKQLEERNESEKITKLKGEFRNMMKLCL